MALYESPRVSNSETADATKNPLPLSMVTIEYQARFYAV